MLTEKCLRVMSRFQQISDDLDEAQSLCCLHQLMKNVYVCGAPLTLDQLQTLKFTHLVNIDSQWFHNSQCNPTIDASDPSVQFELLSLHFGEPFRMLVLPNVYKFVKFLDKALENSGKVLIGEENGIQKSATLAIAFIMYRFRLKFAESFHIVRKLSSVNLVLDTHLIAQMHEYEPILETQRKASLGSSCSGEIRSARLKRKSPNTEMSPMKSHILPTLVPFDDASNNNNNCDGSAGLVQKMET